MYIAPDGTVHQNKPWGVRKITDMFWACVAFVVMFFKTLFNFDTNSTSSSNRSGNGRGGGAGPPDGPGGRRRMGRIQTLPECNIPGGG